MEKISIVIILLAVVTALAQLTDKIKIPYPILLVLAGIGIGLVPGLPIITLDPDVVFLRFLHHNHGGSLCSLFYSRFWLGRVVCVGCDCISSRCSSCSRSYNRIKTT